MSIEISKILIIKSPQHLFQILKDNNSKIFILFKDYMDLFLNGCPCDAEENWDKALIEYQKFNVLKSKDLSYQNCTSFIFQLEGNDLFPILQTVTRYSSHH